MSRPAPPPAEIQRVAAEINRHALQGKTVALPAEAVDQLYTAIPGKQGEGLRILQEALHPALCMKTIEQSGDLMFWLAVRGGQP